MLKVAAFTPGWNIPSARFRVRQYLNALRAEGIELSEFVAPYGAYPPQARPLRPLWAGATLISRLPGVVASYRYDLSLLQREMVSTYTTLESFVKGPRVLDIDDAIWLHPRGAFAEKLAGSCAGVICGNAFLADHLRQWNPRVVVIPTAVDTERFTPGAFNPEPVIGWTGTRFSFRYLSAIEGALAVVLREVPGARLRVVSDEYPRFTAIPPERVEFLPWSESGEVQAVRGMAVGIMPLDDTPWARGKCSFKMLTYMACGVPVVVSPVGMNREVLAQGDVGVGAGSTAAWTEALLGLLRNPALRQRMGREGRRLTVERYSVRRLAPVLGRTLHEFAEQREELKGTEAVYSAGEAGR